MTVRSWMSRKAEILSGRLGLSYDHLLGFRFSINVFLAATVVWFTLRTIGDNNPIWAIASMIASSEPQTKEARRFFRGRLVNVLVGCLIGFSFVLTGNHSHWMIPVALGVTVLISSLVVRVKAMWRQAPITAAIIIASGIAGHSSLSGIYQGLHKVAEVIFGCIVGLLVSRMMSKIWLVRQPEAH